MRAHHNLLHVPGWIDVLDECIGGINGPYFMLIILLVRLQILFPPVA
jgi:hypothetical protein